jgi:hypothetical protein
MIIRVGFQSYEFQLVFELPKPLIFASPDEAVRFLKQLMVVHPQVIRGFRAYLARLSDDPETFRLGDQDAIQRMAALLYSRKVVIVEREERGSAKGPTPAATTGVAFPLSERLPRASSVASKPVPASDPPTYDPKLDAVAQAAALVAAAAEARPFCPE